MTTNQTSNDLVAIAGTVREFGKVGKGREYALITPIKANALPWIVTGVPTGIKVGDYVEGSAIPQGRSFAAYDLATAEKPSLKPAKAAEPQVMDQAERDAFGAARKAEEAAAKLDATVQTAAAESAPLPM